MTWEKPLTVTTTTENNQQGLAREPKVVHFDPRVLEVTPIAASGSEGWPSDKEWTVNAVSTRSKKDLIIVPSTREQRKKAKRSRKKEKKVDVASITSSDEPVDTTPLKYKDDISHVIKMAIEGKLLAESSSKVPEPKEVVEPEFTSAVMTTVSIYHNLAEIVSEVTTKSLEEECFTRPNSATWKQDPHHASAITISSFFIECYEADDTELAAFDNEVRTLFISGMEAIGENAERKEDSSSHSKTEITSSNSAGVLTLDNPNQRLKLHQVWQSEEEPSAEEIPTREDEVVGATTFQMTEGMIPPGSWKEVEIWDNMNLRVNADLTENEVANYKKFLVDYRDIFAFQMSDLKGILPEIGTHRIDIKSGAVPVRQRQYRLNDKYSLLVKENLDSLLSAGFIYPVLSSEWVSPIVVVPKKKTGKIQGQDFRRLNEVTLKDHHPLPFTDVILDQVAGHECYSFLDGFSGYNQVFLREEDCQKTTFTTDWGTFAYRVMPFGLTNVPATFQRMMTTIFRDYLRKFIEVFLDNFCVYSSKATHQEKLKLTFDKCRESQLCLHPEKSFIAMKEGILLGHRISIKGIDVDHEKVAIIVELQPPSCVRDKDDKGHDHPIYFSGKKLSDAEKKYTTTEREALSMVFSVRKFRHYLLGYESIFHVNHYSLKHLVKKADLSRRIARWILRLQEFDISVEWRRGSQHANADYLSRLKHLHDEPNDKEINCDFPNENLYVVTIEDITGSWYEEIWRFLLTQEYSRLMNQEQKRVFLRKVTTFEIVNDKLFKLGMDEVYRRCLEKPEVNRIIQLLHSRDTGGHFGIQTTARKIIKAAYWWPTLYRDVADYVKRCDPCQRTGRPTATTRWPLTSILPLAPFEKWGLDFVGPISPATQTKKRYILVATDYLTRMVEAEATRKDDAATVAKFLFEKIICRYGVPLELVSDRGTHFVNKTISALTERYGIKIKLEGVLLAFRTAEKTTTKTTLFYLCYGMEPITPVEVELPTYRVDIVLRMGVTESLRLRESELINRKSHFPGKLHLN
ncbi:hypothetical protein R1sor_017642 [Riccia sorocarpa]|uniref:Integrase catalytic domain-containing protein n=1 Tax=Riccia sorocarpa TaxID=122646 RepID=A0ABD3IB40_9MARC